MWAVQEFRRRVSSLERQRQAELDELRHLLQQGGGGGGGSSGGGGTAGSLDSESHGFHSGGGGGGGGDSGREVLQWPRAGGMGEAKLAYIRHMVLQYLACRDALVKPHIEAALMVILRCSDAEKEQIEARQKDEVAADSLSSLTNFLGVFT
jgi:hypothetical protein